MTSQFSHDDYCFVCGKKNLQGLRLDFKHGPEAEVEATFFPKQHYQSYDGVLHGGIQSLLLDACMNQVLKNKGINAVTAKLELRYKRSVSLEEEILVHAKYLKTLSGFFWVNAVIFQNGLIKTKAQGVFCALELN